MAEICNQQNPTLENQRTRLAGLDDVELRAQEIIQQGGIHAIATLLKEGCTEQKAMEMLNSLRYVANLIRDEYDSRGQTPLFDKDQTEFQ